MELERKLNNQAYSAGDCDISVSDVFHYVVENSVSMFIGIKNHFKKKKEIYETLLVSGALMFFIYYSNFHTPKNTKVGKAISTLNKNFAKFHKKHQDGTILGATYTVYGYHNGNNQLTISNYDLPPAGPSVGDEITISARNNNEYIYAEGNINLFSINIIPTGVNEFESVTATIETMLK